MSIAGAPRDGPSCEGQALSVEHTGVNRSGRRKVRKLGTEETSSGEIRGSRSPGADRFVTGSQWAPGGPTFTAAARESGGSPGADRFVTASQWAPGGPTFTAAARESAGSPGNSLLAGGERAREERAFTTIPGTGESVETRGNPLLAGSLKVSEAHKHTDFVDEADEPTAGPQSPEIVEAIRDEAVDGVSEYIANGLEADVLQRVFACWQAPDLAELARAAEAVGGLESELHTILAGEPAAKMLADLGIPASDLLSSLLEAMPIKIIDQQLGDMKRGIEIAGIAIGIISGNPLMAIACFKALIHDLIHDIIVSVIKSFLTGGPAEAPGEEVPAVPDALLSGRIPTIRPSSDATGGLGPERPDNQDMHRREPEPARISREAPLEPKREPMTTSDNALQHGLGGARASDATVGEPRIGPEPAADQGLGTAESRAGAETRMGGVIREAREGSEGAGLAVVSYGNTATSSGSPPPIAVPAELMLVRLRIHYQPTEAGLPAGAGIQPVPVMVLFIEYETSGIQLTGPRQATGGLGGQDVGDVAGFLVEEQDNVHSRKTCQLWRAANDAGFADGSAGADALRRRLRNIFKGQPPDLHDPYLISEVPSGRPDWLLDPGTRCIELAGFIKNEANGKKTLLGAGIKASILDELYRIAASVISDSGI